MHTFLFELDEVISQEQWILIATPADDARSNFTVAYCRVAKVGLNKKRDEASVSATSLGAVHAKLARSVDVLEKRVVVAFRGEVSPRIIRITGHKRWHSRTFGLKPTRTSYSGNALDVSGALK